MSEHVTQSEEAKSALRDLDIDVFLQQMRGRAQFLRKFGEVKSPEFLEIAAEIIAAQKPHLTIPDALTRADCEGPEYTSGWNDCRAEMLKGMK